MGRAETPTIGPFVLPRLVPHVTRQFPRLRLALREDRTAPLLDRLGDGRLDVLLMAFPYVTEGCETMMLFEDAYRFACDASHPLS
jgi:LysR family hydrogen peroxide-inducible transcriptional activator